MAQKTEELKKVILEKGLLDEKTLQNYIAQSVAKGMSLEDFLFERHVISDEELGQIVAGLYEVPFVKLADLTINDSVLPYVPFPLASHQFVIPFEKTLNTLKVAIEDPDNFELLNSLENMTGLTIEPYYATHRDIQLALKVYSRDVNQKFSTLLKGALSDPNDLESLKDASKIVDTIILFAYQSDASDVHLEPHKDSLVVRYRIDGILHTIAELPIAIADLTVTRIKVLSNLRTDEHRASQDGRFRIVLENNEITLRVSILPTYDGEKVVMRLLSAERQELDLEVLGYHDDNLKKIQNNILKTHGIILMTGPTGSGKTTTLYSIMKLINSPGINISTIEDPIEYRLEGINQTQVNPKTGLTFANGLRSLVRQDPDVIMVGEIRDEETASVAINAALTGHLVLATLHTNDAASTLPRMQEMGVENFLLAATAQMVIAQRLVRKICEKCKKPYEVDVEQLAALGKKFALKEDLKTLFAEVNDKVDAPSITLYMGEGCAACGNSGFKGRSCIAEVMEVTEEIKKQILASSRPKDLEDVAISQGMRTMFLDGLLKVLHGETTIEEVLRVMRA